MPPPKPAAKPKPEAKSAVKPNPVAKPVVKPKPAVKPLAKPANKAVAAPAPAPEQVSIPEPPPNEPLPAIKVTVEVPSESVSNNVIASAILELLKSGNTNPSQADITDIIKTITNKN